MAKLAAVARKQPIYRVRFHNEGKIFELYAKSVGQGALFGFVEIAELVWGRKSDIIVDPTEQDLKNEFDGVQRIHVPMHAIVRIDEVEKSGGGKIISLNPTDKTSAPGVPIYTPTNSTPSE